MRNDARLFITGFPWWGIKALKDIVGMANLGLCIPNAWILANVLRYYFLQVRLRPVV